MLTVGVFACHRIAQPQALEPDPTARFIAAAAEAARLVPDQARGGPTPLPYASPLPPFAGVNRATAGYAGQRTCAGCHAAEYAIWLTTAHPLAEYGLAKAGAENRADCVGCHYTGYLQPGGVPDRLPLQPPPSPAVDCEACHGPGSDHVRAKEGASGTAEGQSGVPKHTAAPAPGRASRPTYGELPRSAAACVACHTWERSPDFDFAVAWAKVAH